jgi:hypothetical protein
VVGYGKWLSVPRTAGGYGLAMTNFLCVLFPIVVLLLSCAGAFLPRNVGALLSNLLGLANMAAALTGFVCSLLFIRQIGVALDDPATRSGVVKYAIWVGISIVVALMSFCVVIGGGIALASVASNDQSGSSGGGLGIVGIGGLILVMVVNLVIFLVTLVMYFGMLNTAIRAIDVRSGAVA